MRRLAAERAQLNLTHEATVRELQARVDAAERENALRAEQQNADVHESVRETNEFIRKVRLVTTIMAGVAALLLLLNAAFQWVDWQKDYLVLYVVGMALTLYGTMQQFLKWPTFGFGTLLNLSGERVLRRKLEKRGVGNVPEASRISWRYGEASLDAI